MGLFSGSDRDKEIKRLDKEADNARVDGKFAKTDADRKDAEKRLKSAAKERDRLKRQK